MPKAYWVGSHMTVKDPSKLKAYATLASQATADHGGRVLARGGVGSAQVVSVEGFEQSRVAITEFPNMEAALACLDSAAYKAAMAELGDSLERDIFIVEGLD